MSQVEEKLQQENSKPSPRFSGDLPPVPSLGGGDIERTKRNYEITVTERRHSPISPLLKTGENLVPLGSTRGQYFLVLPTANRQLTIAVSSLLDSPKTFTRDAGDKQVFRELLRDPARLGQMDIVIANITDRWGLASAGTIISGFAATRTANNKRPSDLLIVTTTNRENAGNLDYLPFLGRDEIPGFVRYGLMAKRFFTLNAERRELLKERAEILQAITPLSPLLRDQRISILVNKESGTAAILLSISPEKFNREEAQKIEAGLLNLIERRARKQK